VPCGIDLGGGRGFGEAATRFEREFVSGRYVDGLFRGLVGGWKAQASQQIGGQVSKPSEVIDGEGDA
jgi:hypothetical protein